MDTTGGCILERSRKSLIPIVNRVLDEDGILKSYDCGQLPMNILRLNILQPLHQLGNTRTSRRLLIGLASSLVLTMFAGCTAASIPDPTPPGTAVATGSSRSIVWGKADLEPTDVMNKWLPTVDYLAANLSDVGIDSGEMRIARDSETLGQWMAAGEVDLVVDSFYPAMITSETSGAVPLAVRSTGKPDKHAVFFVRADENPDSLSGLVGKTIAFEGRDSTSGFMLPLAHLRQMGFETAEQPAPESAVRANEIGYVFAGDDDVVATWVLEGRVIAGVVDNGTFEEFDAQNPGKLAVLSETISISSDNIVLIRKDMDPAMAAAIKAALLGMKDTGYMISGGDRRGLARG
jgi:phosphonate transport system substrate-binding protein